MDFSIGFFVYVFSIHYHVIPKPAFPQVRDLRRHTSRDFDGLLRFARNDKKGGVLAMTRCVTCSLRGTKQSLVVIVMDCFARNDI
jgi:hypothetical protein